MNAFQKPSRVLASAVVLGFCILAVLAGSANAIVGPTTLTFKELSKGATTHFVDNAPKTTLKPGGGLSISAGDMLLTTNPLEMDGKVVGKIRIVCTATSSANTKNLGAADFNCIGIARIPGGSLVLVAGLSEGSVEGAVTGGTGIYAGARGTFVSRNVKGGSTNTVTLLE
jgi:hypothetical protein